MILALTGLVVDLTRSVRAENYWQVIAHTTNLSGIMWTYYQLYLKHQQHFDNDKNGHWLLNEPVSAYATRKGALDFSLAYRLETQTTSANRLL